MKKKKLTKKEISEILDSYSLRPNDFEEISEAVEPGYKYVYKSRRPKERYLIFIMPQPDNVILANHTDEDGCRTFTDTWRRNKDGSLKWMFRNPTNVPLSDIAAFDDIKKENDELREEVIRLQERLKEKEHQISWAISDTSRKLESENEQLRAELEKYHKTQPVIDTGLRKAGRPKGSIKKKGIENDIEALMREGLSDKDIIARLGLSRATYYRRKKLLIGETIIPIQ